MKTMKSNPTAEGTLRDKVVQRPSHFHVRRQLSDAATLLRFVPVTSVRPGRHSFFNGGSLRVDRYSREVDGLGHAKLFSR